MLPLVVMPNNIWCHFVNVTPTWRISLPGSVMLVERFRLVPVKSVCATTVIRYLLDGGRLFKIINEVYTVCI